MKEIKSITLSRLHQEEAFEFHRLVLSHVTNLKHEKLSGLGEQYAKAFQDFDEALKQSNVSIFTKEITELDERRDWAYRALAGHLKNMTSHFDPNKAEAARKLSLILKNYGDPTNLPYMEESGTLENLIQDMKKPAASDWVFISMTENWITELEQANVQFSQLFSTRNNEQGLKVAGIAQDCRKMVDAAYLAYVKRLNALVELHGEEKFQPFIDPINELINYQKSVLAARKTTLFNKQNKKITE